MEKHKFETRTEDLERIVLNYYKRNKNSYHPNFIDGATYVLNLLKK